MKKIEAIPVKVDRATYKRVQRFSKVTQMSCARTVTRAINDWMDTVGKVQMEAVKESGGTAELREMARNTA